MKSAYMATLRLAVRRHAAARTTAEDKFDPAAFVYGLLAECPPPAGVTHDEAMAAIVHEAKTALRREGEALLREADEMEREGDR